MQVALWPALQLLVKRHNNGMAAVEEGQGPGTLRLAGGKTGKDKKKLGLNNDIKKAPARTLKPANYNLIIDYRLRPALGPPGILLPQRDVVR